MTNTPRITAGRIAALLFAAVAVGMFFEFTKGDGTNAVRYVIGNLAAPWLIVPFIGGRSVRSPWLGAFFGGALAVVSLLSFYAVLEVTTHSLSVHVLANYVLFVTAGAVVGAMTGASASMSLRHSMRWLALGLPALFVLEPLVAFAIGFSGGRSTSNVVVWCCELVLGVVGIGAVTRRWRSSRPARP